MVSTAKTERLRVLASWHGSLFLRKYERPNIHDHSFRSGLDANHRCVAGRTRGSSEIPVEAVMIAAAVTIVFIWTIAINAIKELNNE